MERQVMPEMRVRQAAVTAAVRRRRQPGNPGGKQAEVHLAALARPAEPHLVEQVHPEVHKVAPQAEPMEQLERPAKVALRPMARQQAAQPVVVGMVAPAVRQVDRVPLQVPARAVQRMAEQTPALDRPAVGPQAAVR
jgi:hypothetical protein